MKRLLLFLARSVAISLLFIPLLPFLHLMYKRVLTLVTTGEMPTTAMTTPLNYDSAGSLYTFLVLFLAIPGMEVRKRIVGVVTGIALFLLADSLMTGFLTPYIKTHRLTLAIMAVKYGWLVVAHYLLPFLLWIVFAFRQIEGMCKVQMPDRVVNEGMRL